MSTKHMFLLVGGKQQGSSGGSTKGNEATLKKKSDLHRTVMFIYKLQNSKSSEHQLQMVHRQPTAGKMEAAAEAAVGAAVPAALVVHSPVVHPVVDQAALVRPAEAKGLFNSFENKHRLTANP